MAFSLIVTSVAKSVYISSLHVKFVDHTCKHTIVLLKVCNFKLQGKVYFLQIYINLKILFA